MTVIACLNQKIKFKLLQSSFAAWMAEPETREFA
jgi:hypothetical protein